MTSPLLHYPISPSLVSSLSKIVSWFSLLCPGSLSLFLLNCKPIFSPSNSAMIWFQKTIRWTIFQIFDCTIGAAALPIYWQDDEKLDFVKRGRLSARFPLLLCSICWRVQKLFCFDWFRLLQRSGYRCSERPATRRHKFGAFYQYPFVLIRVGFRWICVPLGSN